MKIAAVLATSILSFAALAAQAASPANAKSITVQFADLDLDHKAGVFMLFERIKDAAKYVCGDQAGETLIAKRTYAACVELAVSTAVARVDRPALSDYVARQTRKPLAAAPARVAVR